MESIKFNYLLLILLMLSIISCKDDSIKPSYNGPDTVVIGLMLDEWSESKDGTVTHKYTKYHVSACEGQHFGPFIYLGSDGEVPFRVVKIINERKVIIEFCDNLYILEGTEYYFNPAYLVITTSQTILRAKTFTKSSTDFILSMPGDKTIP